MSAAFWSVGECMLELRPQSHGTLAHAAAGDSYNTAVYLKRLVPDMPVRYVSALGDDAMSGLIRDHMWDERIDDSLIDIRPGGTAGLYAIATDANGERRFTYWRAQSAARGMLSAAHLAQLGAQLAECRVLLLTGITLAILDDERRAALLSLAAQVRAAGGWVALDNNYRPALWNVVTAREWMDRAAQVCTHALFSFDDEVLLHGDRSPAGALARIAAIGVPEVVLKLGADGCLIGGAAEHAAQPEHAARPEHTAQPVHVPALAVRAVDTTAAGDSFNAGYLAQRLRGASSIKAAEFGCAVAAAVVTHPGAIIPAAALPSLNTEP
ncbi:sugar kinase [Rugamonas sp. FT107W]|uniref:Sugar kinase n=1 Tax=Duganella vulcania TaxID=2692166 RepID=A0A845HRK7_9BURK|nr:sugar kinase [Duganella vulcania]MYN20093.1 sugar kinase [Duganella vulcania]